MPALHEIIPYLKRSVGFVEVDLLLAEEARQREGTVGFSKNIIDLAELGCPSFEFRNVESSR